MIITQSLTQALLFLPLSLGILLSYRITKLTDLTVESSFLTGSAVFTCLLSYMPFSCALILGALSGCITGGFSAFIQRHGRMNSLMASILAVFMFFSVNLLVMGKPHVSLSFHVPMWANVVVVLFVSVFLFVLLSSRYGLKLRAFGDNPALFQDLFGTQEKYRMLGLCVSNVCAAIAGLMTALHQGYVDLYMGQGVALLGIGTVVMADRMRVPHLLACAISVWAYFLLSHLLLMFDISTIYLRLIIGAVLILMLRRTS